MNAREALERDYDDQDRLHDAAVQNWIDEQNEKSLAECRTLAESFIATCHVTAEQKKDLVERLAETFFDAGREFIREERLPT